MRQSPRNTETSRRVWLLGGAAAALVVVAALIWFARRPASVSVADPARFVPSSCGAALWLPSLDRAGQAFRTLSRLKAAQYVLTDERMTAVANMLTKGVRLDRDPSRALTALGLDPREGLFVHVGQSGDTLLLWAPGNDPSKLVGRVRELASAWLGGVETSRRNIQGHQYEVLLAGAAKTPAVAYSAMANGALVALGKDPDKTLAEALTRPTNQSLAANESFDAARKARGAADLLVFVCPGAQAIARQGSQTGTLASIAGALAPNGGALALSVDTRRANPTLVVDLDMTITETLARALSPAAVPGESGAALGARLDPDAFLTFRTRADPVHLKPIAESLLPKSMVLGLQETGLDLETDVFANLRPGFAASVALSPVAKMDRMPALNTRATNPFQYVRFEALGQVKDAERAAEALKKVAEAAPRFGARAEERTVGDTRTTVFRYKLGEGASFALSRGYVAVSGGDGSMERLLARLGEPAPSRAANDAEVFHLSLDLAKLIAAIRAMPDSAFGVGGSVVRQGMDRLFDMLLETPGLTAKGALEGRLLATHIEAPLVPPPEKAAGTP